MINNETKRVLIGWTEILPANLLAGNNPQAVTVEHQTRVQQAVNAKNRRPLLVNPVNVISDPPAELEEYVSGFWQQPNIEIFIHEGWTIKMANLNNVCTVQPAVENKKSIERSKNIVVNNIIGIAEITLPYNTPQLFSGFL